MTWLEIVTTVPVLLRQLSICVNGGGGRDMMESAALPFQEARRKHSVIRKKATSYVKAGDILTVKLYVVRFSKQHRKVRTYVRTYVRTRR